MKKIISMLLLALMLTACNNDQNDILNDFEVNRLTTNYPLANYTYDTEVKLSASIGEGLNTQSFGEVGFIVSKDRSLLSSTLDAEGVMRVVATIDEDLTSFSAWIEELELGIRYYAEAYIIASDGEVTLGTTISFETAQNSTPDIVFTDITIQAINAKDVYVYCAIDEDSGATNDQVIIYGVKYWAKEGDGSDITTLSFDRDNANFYFDSVKGFRAYVSNITPNKEYDFEFFGYSRREANVQENNTDIESESGDKSYIVGLEATTPAFSVIEEIFAGSKSLKVSATISDVGGDPDLRYGFRIVGGSIIEPVEYILSPEEVLTDEDKAADGMSISHYFEGLELSTEYTITAFAVNTLLEESPETIDQCSTLTDMTVTTTNEEDVVWSIDQFSATNYPTDCDNWLITNGDNYSTSASYYSGLRDALSQEANAAREIKITFVDLEELPYTAFAFTSTVYGLHTISLPSALTLQGHAIKYATSLKEVYAPRALVLNNTSIGFNDYLEYVYIPKLKSIASDGSFTTNPLLSRINSDEEGVAYLPELTSIDGASVFNNDASLKVLDMPKLTYVKNTTASILGALELTLTHLYLDELTELGGVAYSLPTTLEEVYLPKIKEITAGTFYNSTTGFAALKKVTLSPYTSIGYQSFRDCDNLEELNYSDYTPEVTPETIYIGYQSFFVGKDDTTYLEFFQHPHATHISTQALQNRSVREVYFPEAKEVCNNSLQQMFYCEKLYIPKVTRVSGAAFIASSFTRNWDTFNGTYTSTAQYDWTMYLGAESGCTIDGLTILGKTTHLFSSATHDAVVVTDYGNNGSTACYDADSGKYIWTVPYFASAAILLSSGEVGTEAVVAYDEDGVTPLTQEHKSIYLIINKDGYAPDENGDPDTSVDYSEHLFECPAIVPYTRPTPNYAF
ncbi:MAG: leucine-rich repeat protein [Rikenellaceae bacterium]